MGGNVLRALSITIDRNGIPETLSLGDFVQIWMTDGAFHSGTLAGYCLDGGVVSYIELEQKLKEGVHRALLRGEYIREAVSVQKSKERRKR